MGSLTGSLRRQFQSRTTGASSRRCVACSKEPDTKCADVVSSRSWPKYGILGRVQAMSGQVPEEMEPVLEQERRPARSRSVELAREGRRAQKLDRYEQVIELHQQGVKAADIASRMRIGERTVHR